MPTQYLIIILASSLLCYSIIPTLRSKLAYRLDKRISSEKKLFLTFDDGPNPRYTYEILDLLKKYNINASFFMVASFAKANPAIVRRIQEDGHAIGLHSLEHKNALWKTPFYTKTDFDKSMQIMDKLGVQIRFFRPPWGHFNLAMNRQIKKYRLQTVLWDTMAEDWRGKTTSQEITNKLLKRTQNGSIICLHDGRGKNEAPGRTVAALKQVLPDWVSKGYRFLTVEDL